VEAATARDVQHLEPRQIASVGVRRAMQGVDQRQLERIPFGTRRVLRVVPGGSAEARWIEVAAAAEQDAVDVVEQRGRILVAGRQQHRPPATAPHRVDVGAGTKKRGRSSPSRW